MAILSGCSTMLKLVELKSTTLNQGIRVNAKISSSPAKPAKSLNTSIAPLNALTQKVWLPLHEYKNRTCFFDGTKNSCLYKDQWLHRLRETNTPHAILAPAMPVTFETNLPLCRPQFHWPVAEANKQVTSWRLCAPGKR